MKTGIRKLGKYIKGVKKHKEWLAQFDIVPFDDGGDWNIGRCTNCDGGADPKIECADYGCPCKDNEQMKRKPVNESISKK